MAEFRSTFVVIFSAETDAEACVIAGLHLAQLEDALAIEGADHPKSIMLAGVMDTDERAVLAKTLTLRVPRPLVV